MKFHLLFIGNKFVYNKALREYIMRKVEQNCEYISSITHFKEGENTLFLYLEEYLNTQSQLIVVTTKNNFSTVGKVISTVTGDNQVLKENMLIPSNSEIYKDSSYLLEFKESIVNVIAMDEMKKMPDILISSDLNKEIVNLFDEDRESALALLNPVAQTYDVNLEVVTIVEGWLQLQVQSKKYGNISNFIESSKQLLPQKLIVKENIITHIIETLDEAGRKISFAESCTGGLLSYYFTSHNGASKILDGALITYSNDLKDNWIAVEEKLFEEYGAVSAQVVEQMSEGAMNVSDADYTIAISGIAGDTGGTDEKPVGTVFIGVRTSSQHKEFRLQLSGDRNYVQHQSALFAIKLLVTIDKEIFF